jgi:fructose-bisphosphate aldolase class II
MSAVLSQAEKGGYAVGAFNAHNLEMIPAILEAARQEAAPVILQASAGTLKFSGAENIGVLVRSLASGLDIPVALHLDHGEDYRQVITCIRAGFSSVMIDGSKHPLPANIALTRKVVEAAHWVGVSVEAELGRLGGAEDDLTVDEKEAGFTDPAEAETFVRESGVDALAVSIGTAHGVYKGEPKLDFARLREIDSRVQIPIVLHGASGVPDEAIRQAISQGVRKVNIATELKLPWVGAIRKVLTEKPEESDPRKVLGPAREAVIAVVREKTRLFGASGRAGDYYR